MVAMTEQEKKATIMALLNERRGYEAAGLEGRVAEVNAQLRRLGHEAEPERARAESRSGAKPKASTRSSSGQRSTRRKTT